MAYCLGIVDLDPIRYDLLFERFLNPGRKQMPDIDMDFDERYRAEMIRYAAERYGADQVAQIVTFSTIKARAAVRDAARVLGLPVHRGRPDRQGHAAAHHGPRHPAAGLPRPRRGTRRRLRRGPGLRDMYATDPEARRVIDVAKGLEGLRRQDGIHAAAVVITKDPLTEYLPIQRKPESGQDPAEAPDRHPVRDARRRGAGPAQDGLPRPAQPVGHRAGPRPRGQAPTGERPDIDAIPLDDPSHLRDAAAGRLDRRVPARGRPHAVAHAVARPDRRSTTWPPSWRCTGPGRWRPTCTTTTPTARTAASRSRYLHPDLEPILGDTYGLMIYQESVMRVAQRFAGYTLEEADNLRKACGKKIRGMIQAEREKFVAGCVTQGYERELGTKLFDIIEPFADYAFNKSHSYGYGLVAYQTAWLKAHYPVEYFAALLTSVKDDKDRTAVYLGECRTLGIEVLVPDVNRSAAEFTPLVGEDGARRIVFGLAAVRNVGEGLVERIVAEREANGPFADFYDFCRRVDPMVLNKRTVESLVKAGAFDSLGHPRQGLCLVFEEIVDRTLERRREEQAGISTLVLLARGLRRADGGTAPGGLRRRPGCPIPDTEFAKTQRLAFEKEMLGLYVSDHPLRGFEAALARLTDCSIADLKELDDGAGDGSGRDGQVRTVGGVVTALVRRYTKRGELMATFVLEDLRASIEVFVFPKVMPRSGALLADDAVVVLRGRVDTRDDQVKLVCMEVHRPELAADGAGELRVELPLGVLTDDVVDRLKQLLREHPGDEPVFLHVGQTVLRLPAEFNVDSRRGLLGELRVLLGPNAIWPDRRPGMRPPTCAGGRGTDAEVAPGWAPPAHPVSW